MIDRENPTMATCDSETNCDATVLNENGMSLVEFQRWIAAENHWSWNVDYEEIYSYCPEHRSEFSPHT